jgi:DNA-binding winged helix-turn-helix (wHTH) protein
MPVEMDGNPFYHLRAIDKVEHFYDRCSEVRQALRLLRRAENVEITGPRRIGKTSFLRHLAHPTVLQKHGLDPQRNVFVYIDCQRRRVQGEASLVYKRMLERIVEAAYQAGVDLVSEAHDGAGGGAAFEQALEEMSRRGLRTILLLDEFEAMARNPNLDVVFFNNLRALCGPDQIDVAYVTASRTSLADLCLDRQSLLSSPFFNIFRPIRLKLFSEQDSRQLVKESLRRAGGRFPGGLLDLVLEVGGRHPFFLQMAGYHAFESSFRGKGLAENERRTFLGSVNEEAAGHFKAYWKKLDKREQYVLAALPLLQQDLSCQGGIEHLRDQCLIAERDGEYDYFSPLFKKFVRHQSVNGVLQAGALLVDQRRGQVLLRGEPLGLSPTNYALLTCLMQRAGQVVRNEELWQAAWSEESHNADEQLKSGIKSLRKALGDDADCIVNKRGVGYLFRISLE